MTTVLEDAISEARWKARNRNTEQYIVRFKQACGKARYISVARLTGVIKKTRVGESPLCILNVAPDGWIRSMAVEFDSHTFNQKEGR